MADWKGSLRDRATLAATDTASLPDLLTIFILEDPSAFYTLNKASTETVDGDNYLTAVPSGRWVKSIASSTSGGGGGGGTAITISSTNPVAGNVAASATGELYIEKVVQGNFLDNADLSIEINYVTWWQALSTAAGDWEAFDGSQVTFIVTLDNLGEIFNLGSFEADILGFNAQYNNQVLTIFEDTSGYGAINYSSRYQAILSQSDPWVQLQS